MQAIECQVHSISPLTDYVYKVLLKPNAVVDFLPGQYLNFVLSAEDKRPFSIASAPNAEFVELQIGAFGEDSYAMQVIEHIKENNTVNVEIAMGDAYLREDSERPVLLVAGGTGFSYIKSMFAHLAEQQSNREVIVYWGLRDASACYEFEQTQALVNKLAHGQFIPVVETGSADWHGKEGLVHKVVMADLATLAPYDIYIAGRFDMVGILRDDFLAHGAEKDHMFADAFAFI